MRRNRLRWMLPVLRWGGAPPQVIFTCTTTGAATLTLNRLGAVTGKTIHVDWGDGTSNDYSDNPVATRTHDYAGAGVWKVTISPPTAVVNLDLRDTKLSCAAGQIGKMTALTSLYLENLANVTIGAGEIGGLINLAHLYLINSNNIAFQTGLANLLKLTTLQYENGLSQAQVDSVLTQMYAAFPSRTGTNGTIDLLGDGNAAPSGTAPGSAECPPTTGWNKAYELVNDSCGVSSKHWASVTCQT